MARSACSIPWPLLLIQVPLDMTLSHDGQFLYVFNSGSHTIQGFTVHGNGSLSWTTTVSNVPDGADGLAAN
ncbi:MAG TPA: hypothetical protein VFE98_05375 [Candidatus Bathyarchaeia archaeon]|nr:hypothetical protein [Candidatus Bathyarchaeia archaeon]